MLRRFRFAAVFILFISFAFAQTTPPQTADVDARARGLLKQLTLEEKIDLIGGVDDFYIRDIKHIALPRLKMADGPVGVRNYGPSTAFGGIGLAATWDPELVQRVATILGQNARARGVHFLLGPGVNIYRAPMCGRNFEYFGEDPFLASRTAVAYIRGIQSQGVSATIKHFMGNNSEFLRHDLNSIIDERTMREIYLPTFEAAVKEAHVGAIMDSYNLTNGEHLTQNSYLNIDVAKKEWGFDGIMMSDWDSTYDGVAAVNGGLDLEMPSGKFMNRKTLLPAVKAGKVTEPTIDDKILRILRTAIRFGWLERDQTDLSVPIFNQEGREVALEAARSAIVLLKNDGNLLPLKKRGIKAIAVIGPNAYPPQPVGGGSARVQPFMAVSYVEGLAAHLAGAAKVYYHPGLPSYEEMADSTAFTTGPNNHQAGLNAEIYNNPSLSGTPAITRRDEHINPNRSLGAVAQNDVSARWTGYFTPSSPGDHLVFVHGPGENGGYRLCIDDKPVFDTWQQATAPLSQATMTLSAGPHKIRLEYFVRESWGGPRVRLGIVQPKTLISPEAKKIAAQADAVVVAVGFDPETETEGADRTFRLPPGQDELIQQMAAANKNTIVAITSGGGVDMNSWLDRVPALIETWYSGQEGGTALAQLVFGDYSPSGRLPISIERRWEDNAVHDNYYPQNGQKAVTYKEGVFLGYRHFDKSGIKPAFPFGYGLSYTTFAYKNLTIAPESFSGDQPVTVSFDVTNTGDRAGAEVAQVYVGEPRAVVPRPVKELKGFEKIYLSPTETKHVSITLDRRAFSYYDVKNHRWTADPGEFDIYVCRSAEQTELKGKVNLQAP